MKNKRGQSESGFGTVAVIVATLVGFGILLALVLQVKEGIVSKGEDALCLGTVAFKEAASDKLPIAFCPTKKHVEIPVSGEGREAVMLDMANFIVNCRQRVGDLSVKDPFKEASRTPNNCVVCQPFKPVKSGDFNDENRIKSEEFFEFLRTTIYEVDIKTDACSNGGGVCISDGPDPKSRCESEGLGRGDDSFRIVKNDKCGAGEVCCASWFLNRCANRGGKCSPPDEFVDEDEYRKFDHDSWKCPDKKIQGQKNKKQVCYVPKGNYFSYLRKIQFGNGDLDLAILTEEFIPGHEYTISYGAPDRECGDFCDLLGLGAGAITAIAGLGLGVFGLAFVATASGAVAWYVDEKSEKVVEAYRGKRMDASKERRTHTIYVSTLNQIQKNEACTLV